MFCSTGRWSELCSVRLFGRENVLGYVLFGRESVLGYVLFGRESALSSPFRLFAKRGGVLNSFGTSEETME